MLRAGDDYTGAIVGGVVGGIVGLTLLALVAGLAFWSWKTFSFRARRRLIEDQVYSIIIGAQSNDVYTWNQLQPADKEDQVICYQP